MTIRGSRFAASSLLISSLALGFAVQACGGAPEGSDSTIGQSQEDLSILGIKIPAPSVTVGVGDQKVTIDPVGAIDKVIPDGGIVIDPIKGVNQVTAGIFETLSKPISIGLTAPGVKVGVTAQLPIGELPVPQLPDPGGIQIIGK